MTKAYLDLAYVQSDSKGPTLLLDVAKEVERMLEKDSRVKQLFNTDLLDVQKYLFTKLQIEPTSKVEIEYGSLRLCKISKINDDDRKMSPPPLSVLYAEVKTAESVSSPLFSYGKFTSHQHQQPANNPITSISVRYQKYESVFFHDCEEKTTIENFANYVIDKDPDIIFCQNGSDISSVFQNLLSRTRKLGLETIHFGRD
jgi:DNA polymerase elongation subunit (family B)